MPLWTRLLMTGLLAVSMSLSASADDPKAPVPTPEAIQKAIQNLGSPRFAVREQASKVLWEAGILAEPKLKEALNSEDAEVVRRAKLILEKFEWGIYPDTPPTVLEAVNRFRAATDRNQRREVARTLIRAGKPGCLALRQLLKRVEDNNERQEMFTTLAAEARLAVPGLIGSGDRESAAELLEIGLLGTSDEAFSDFAVFQFMADQLDATIIRFEAQRNGLKEDDLKRVEKVLVHLYRIKTDWVKAIKSADATGDSDLLESVLWEASDWKRLAEINRVPAGRRGNPRGAQLAYERLAGNKQKYAEILDEMKMSVDMLGESYELQQLIEALLLNGHVDDAISILQEKERSLAMLFDLLCTQMRHKEAFKLADAARRRDIPQEERDELEVRRARMLYLLGDRESSAQLFARLADAMIDSSDLRDFRDIIRIEVRLGLREQAKEQAARFLDGLMKREVRDNFQMLLDPIFGQRKAAAETWWWELRTRNPNEPAIVTMKKVGDLLEGTAGKELPDLVKGMDAGGTRPETDRFIALAEAYLAHRKTDVAEVWLKRSAERHGSPQGWIRLGDMSTNRKQYKEAADRYGKAWAADKTQPLPLFLQGLSLVQNGDEKEGKRLIDIAHWLPLGNEEQRCDLAEELGRRGWTDAARREADLVLKTGWYRNWYVGNIISQAARWAVAEKDFGKAADYYERGLIGCMRTGAAFIEMSAYMTVPQASRVYRARALLGVGKIDEAIVIIEDSLKVLPGNVDLAIAVVPELAKQGKKVESDRIFNTVLNAYEKLCTDFPQSAWGHNSAAWLCANCRRDLDKGLVHAEKAVKMEPKNAGHMDTLGEIHFRLKNRDKAIECMKKCLELDPTNNYFRKQLTRFEKGDFDSPIPDEEED